MVGPELFSLAHYMNLLCITGVVIHPDENESVQTNEGATEHQAQVKDLKFYTFTQNDQKRQTPHPSP